jgi:hypothetical protein
MTLFAQLVSRWTKLRSFESLSATPLRRSWRGGNRTHAANVLGISIRALRNKIHLYKHMGLGLSEPSSGRGGATAACPQTDYCSNRNSPAYSPRTTEVVLK